MLDRRGLRQLAGEVRRPEGVWVAKRSGHFRSRAADEPRRREPQRVGEILPQLMARRGYARMISAASYCDAWTKVAGGLARVSRPGLLKRGVLQITVNNSAAVQELTFQKRQLLRDLSAELPEQKISDLRFIVGAID